MIPTSETYTVIGLMSGTSGDGLDIAYCSFTKNNSWSYQIEIAETVSFTTELAQQLKFSHELSALDLSLLDVRFGKWMGECVKTFCNKHQIRPLAVASHGHTVFHQPHLGLSLQIGNGWALHQAAELPVINDFRMNDIQWGGQGAPLVPIGDHLLFEEMDFCLNLGGIANISFISNTQRIAFDVCPFNLLLNEFANKKGLAFDNGGQLAKSGIPSTALLSELNAIEFYKKSTAKSLGREDLDQYFSIINRYSELSIEDVLSTLIEHYSYQIHQTLTPKSTKQKILITGGGAYNTYFIESLVKTIGENFEIVPATPQLIEYKEALIFAFLGVLRLRNEINTLASVTGASKNTIGGIIYST
jgi:anhydro-N-acetylmuramic acid kinase